MTVEVRVAPEARPMRRVRSLRASRMRPRTPLLLPKLADTGARCMRSRCCLHRYCHAHLQLTFVVIDRHLMRQVTAPEVLLRAIGGARDEVLLSRGGVVAR